MRAWAVAVIVQLAALCFTLPSRMPAQVGTSGAILGTVHDPTGAVIPTAGVVVVDERTGRTRTVSTDEAGFFQVLQLPPSEYRVEAQAPGLKQYVRSPITLRVNDSIRLDIELQIGDITESVEVTGATPLLQTTSSTVGTVVESEKVRELPLNGRNFVQLSLLVPGATSGNNAGGVFVIGGSSPSVSGNRSEMNNFTLDGVKNNEHFFKFEAIHPSVDSIQEFKVQTNVTSAQHGARAGANVNVATKSGTNQFHGVVFEFLRNDNLDATDFFAAEKPEFNQNQFGGNLGGPVVRNRTFLFASYEAFRFRRGQNLFSIVPTRPQLAGDLSVDHTGTPAPAIFDPLTSSQDPNNPDQVIRERFPNNRIPEARLNPITSIYADLIYPTPSLQPTPGSTSLGPGQSNNINTNSFARDDDQIIWRVDHQFSSDNNFYARYAHAEREVSQPQPLQTLTQTLANEFNNLAISDTHILSPTTLLDVKFGWIRDNITRVTPPPEPGIGVVLDAGLTGVPRASHGFDFPVNMNIPGFTGPGLYVFTSGPQGTLQWTANLSLIRGKHTINVGADFRHEEVFHDGQFGGWTFDSLPTADPRNTASTGQELASFLLGFPAQANRIVGTTAADLKRRLYHGYFQDDINLTSKLTLNLGVRYEFTQWFRGDYEDGSKLAWFDIGVNAGDPDPLKRGAFVWEGTNPVTGEGPNTRTGFLDPDRNNFAPRVGLAYRLGNKATIRAGYGIFYESNFVWENQSARGNWPFAANQTVTLNRVAGEQPVFVDDVFPELDLANVPPSVGQTQAKNNRVPYVQQWNVNVQYALTPTMQLDVGYVGNKGTKLNQWVEQNTLLSG